VEVLDARHPMSCRLLEAEGSCAAKKPLLIVLNKIDLIPQDVAVRWIAFLCQTAPTVAISATSPAVEVALREAIGEAAPSRRRVAGPR
jgi:ribosome biogenesis GTPase A